MGSRHANRGHYVVGTSNDYGVREQEDRRASGYCEESPTVEDACG